MKRSLTGAVLERAPGPRYWESLALAEIAPRDPLPRASVLARWRREAPESARFTLLAPRDAWSSKQGAFREEKALAAGTRYVVEAADALAADAIVVATGKDVTPGARDRERLAKWIERLAEGGKRKVVWFPGGLWDVEDAAVAARAIGAICGFDPLESTAPPGEIAYARVRAIGARSRLGEGLLASIAETVQAAAAATTYVAIEAPDGPRRAKRLAQLLGTAAPGAPLSDDGDGDGDEDEDADEDDASDLDDLDDDDAE
jgi:uncharacterized protein YecE (DUF72 family)